MSEVVTFTVIQISPFRNRAVDKRNQKCFENYQENIHVKVFLMNRSDCRYLVLDFLKLSQQTIYLNTLELLLHLLSGSVLHPLLLSME